MLDRAELTMETVCQLKTDNPGFVIFTNRYFSSRKFARKLENVAEGTYPLSLCRRCREIRILPKIR